MGAAVGLHDAHEPVVGMGESLAGSNEARAVPQVAGYVEVDSELGLIGHVKLGRRGRRY